MNYSELTPSSIAGRLNELLKRGISQFATFIPWQAMESDISHTLNRLLQAVSDRRMTVYLILSPEVGIHYPNSGLPKDIVSKKDNRAFQGNSSEAAQCLPPQVFALPSFFSPEFGKRYYSFLTRMDNFFSDLAKTQPDLIKSVTVVLSGSYWKYYRTSSPNQLTFGGVAGDYSPHATLAFRQQIEQQYSKQEFMDPTPASSNRWKTRTYEEINRKWFYQQAEDHFRTRSLQSLRKKNSDLKVIELELYTPEADPNLVYSNFLRMVSGGGPDFGALSAVVGDASSRRAWSPSGPASPFFYWTSMGGFKMLSEAQKQFLILKSILLASVQGGGVLVEDADWFGLSPQFKGRVEALLRSISHGELQFRTKALYLTPHLWSHTGLLGEELIRSLGPSLKVVSSLEMVAKERQARLLVVDPSYVFTHDTLKRLLALAVNGLNVVIPKSQLYTEAARRELDQLMVQNKKLDLDLGLPYSLYVFGLGKLIVYDASSHLSMRSEPLLSWQNFLRSIIAVAEVERFYTVKDPRLLVIPFERKDQGCGMFVLNSSRNQISSEIVFPIEVQITDLGVALSEIISGHHRTSSSKNNPTLSSRFTLDVPPYGILPLIVEGLNLSDFRERQIASAMSIDAHGSAFGIAASELPGFNTNDTLGNIWN